MTNITEI